MGLRYILICVLNTFVRSLRDCLTNLIVGVPPSGRTTVVFSFSCWQVVGVDTPFFTALKTWAPLIVYLVMKVV